MTNYRADIKNQYAADREAEDKKLACQIPFNRLTLAEAERLAKLAEECSEVIKAVAKILRHGYESYNPDDSRHIGNRKDLEDEIADVWTIVLLMHKNKDINLDSINALRWPPKKTYWHHQEQLKQ